MYMASVYAGVTEVVKTFLCGRVSVGGVDFPGVPLGSGSCGAIPVYPRQCGRGGMRTCPTRLHVFCGLVEGIRPCPSGSSVGVALGVWGTKLPDIGCSFCTTDVRVFTTLPSVSRTHFQ